MSWKCEGKDCQHQSYLIFLYQWYEKKAQSSWWKPWGSGGLRFAPLRRLFVSIYTRWEEWSKSNHNLLCQTLCHKVQNDRCGRRGQDGELCCCQPLHKSSSQWSLSGDEDLLVDDDTLKTWTTLLPADIMSLNRLCLTTTYFQFGGNFYKQVAVAMGSPPSPVIANKYMQDYERGHWQQPLWSPYCDCAIMTPLPSGTWWQGAANFHEHLNGQCTEIQFKMEKTKRSIPFLNVYVRRDEAKLTTSMYRKPTHTDCYLHYNSNHYPQVTGICPGRWKKHVQKELMANRYP